MSTELPAFPEAIAVGPAGDVYHGFGGMSLRDWFAGQAMQAILSSYRFDETELCAENAYEIADAMLAERSKK